VISSFYLYFQVCIDPLRLFESNKLEHQELEILVIDNFVSMVGAHKFQSGELSDFMILDDYSWKNMECHYQSSELCMYLPFLQCNHCSLHYLESQTSFQVFSNLFFQ